MNFRIKKTIFLPWKYNLLYLGVLELKFQCRTELYCKRTQIAAAHIIVLVFAAFFLAEKFRPVDSSACAFLVKEINHCAAEVKVFVHTPVDTAESLPATIEKRVR